MKACIFDLDGTLMDSMWIWESFARDWLMERKLPYEEAMLSQLQTMTLPQAAVYLKKKYALREKEDAILREFKQRLHNLYAQDVRMKEGVEACLARLFEQGVHLAVLTACDKESAVACLRANHILSYFDVVMSCEEMGYAKTEGRLYKAACAQIKTAPQDTVFVEDALHAITCLCAHGYPVCAVYEECHAQDWPHIKQLAKYHILSFTQWEETMDKGRHSNTKGEDREKEGCA